MQKGSMIQPQIPLATSIKVPHSPSVDVHPGDLQVVVELGWAPALICGFRASGLAL